MHLQCFAVLTVLTTLANGQVRPYLSQNNAAQPAWGQNGQHPNGPQQQQLPYHQQQQPQPNGPNQPQNMDPNDRKKKGYSDTYWPNNVNDWNYKWRENSNMWQPQLSNQVNMKENPWAEGVVNNQKGNWVEGKYVNGKWVNGYYMNQYQNQYPNNQYPNQGYMNQGYGYMNQPYWNSGLKSVSINFDLMIIVATLSSLLFRLY